VYGKKEKLMKKIVCCAGGLGNQMFQYAFYRYLREKGFEVYFDTSSKQLNRHTGFELKRLFPNIQIENRTEIPFIIRRIRHSLFAQCWNFKFPFVAHDSSEDIGQRHCRETVFCGYWQQYRYMESMREQLLSDFQFIPFDRQNEETAAQIDRTNSVSIHIRRGDYLAPDNVQTLGSVCTLDYYKMAIKMINKSVELPLFFVFSDDMAWTKANLPLDNALFIDWNRGKNSFRDMQLMGLCKHNIMANSTFSWWAAWLNQNKDKMVITPAKWNNDKLIPENWKKT
jgi:hypothetical protein